MESKIKQRVLKCCGQADKKKKKKKKKNFFYFFYDRTALQQKNMGIQKSNSHSTTESMTLTITVWTKHMQKTWLQMQAHVLHTNQPLFSNQSNTQNLCLATNTTFAFQEGFLL